MSDEPTIAGAGENTILEGNTYEAHVWLAQRAILTDELTLAIMHLRMAMELQESIIERATRAHVERAGRDVWEKASPGARAAALDKLGELLGEDTAMVPLVGQTRAEVPVRQPLPPIWACSDVRVHDAHPWEEQTDRGLVAYRCLGRTVDIGRVQRGMSPQPADPGFASVREMRDHDRQVYAATRDHLAAKEGGGMTNEPIGSRLFAVKDPSWAPEEAHTERIDVPGHSSATRVCATCGVTWRWFGDPLNDAFHIDEDGTASVDQHHVPHE